MTVEWATRHLWIIFGAPLAITAVLLVVLFVDIATDGRFVTWLFKGRI